MGEGRNYIEPKGMSIREQAELIDRRAQSQSDLD